MSGKMINRYKNFLERGDVINLVDWDDVDDLQLAGIMLIPFEQLENALDYQEEHESSYDYSTVEKEN